MRHFDYRAGMEPPAPEPEPMAEWERRAARRARERRAMWALLARFAVVIALTATCVAAWGAACGQIASYRAAHGTYGNHK